MEAAPTRAKAGHKQHGPHNHNACSSTAASRSSHKAARYKTLHIIRYQWARFGLFNWQQEQPANESLCVGARHFTQCSLAARGKRGRINRLCVKRSQMTKVVLQRVLGVIGKAERSGCQRSSRYHSHGDLPLVYPAIVPAVHQSGNVTAKRISGIFLRKVD